MPEVTVSVYCRKFHLFSYDLSDFTTIGRKKGSEKVKKIRQLGWLPAKRPPHHLEAYFQNSLDARRGCRRASRSAPPPWRSGSGPRPSGSTERRGVRHIVDRSDQPLVLCLRQVLLRFQIFLEAIFLIDFSIYKHARFQTTKHKHSSGRRFIYVMITAHCALQTFFLRRMRRLIFFRSAQSSVLRTTKIFHF